VKAKLPDVVNAEAGAADWAIAEAAVRVRRDRMVVCFIAPPIMLNLCQST
jgi:hypothetical protein